MKFLREESNAYQYKGHTVIQTSSGYRIKDGKDNWIGGEFDTDTDATEYIDELKESFDGSSDYEYIASKSVLDSDGFYTDYTWYKSPDGLNVFVFGDKDFYTPEDGDFDWEEEDDEAAQEWFDSYSGFDDSFLDEDVTDSEPVKLKLSGNMIEIPIEDTSEVGELGHPIQHGIGDPRRKRDLQAQESKRRWARKGLTESMWEKGDSVTLWWTNPQWSTTSPSFAACMYAGKCRDGKHRFISDTYAWTYLLDIDEMTITTPQGKTYPVFNDNGWLKDTVQEGWITKYIPETGDKVTIIGNVYNNRQMTWGTETDEFIGARGVISYVGSASSASDTVEIELEDGTVVWTVSGYKPIEKNPLKESTDDPKQWPDNKELTYDEALRLAMAYYSQGGDGFYETTERYQFEDEVKMFGPKTVGQMKREFGVFDSVAKDRMTEAYNVQFYQVFKCPEKPTDNGKMVAQADSEAEAHQKGKKLCGDKNYLIKAVCDDGKVRDVDLHDYFNESLDAGTDYCESDAELSDDYTLSIWNDDELVKDNVWSVSDALEFIHDNGGNIIKVTDYEGERIIWKDGKAVGGGFIGMDYTEDGSTIYAQDGEDVPTHKAPVPFNPRKWLYGEAKENRPLYVIKDSKGNQLSAPNPDDEELWDRVASMEARGRRGLCVVVYVNNSNSLRETKEFNEDDFDESLNAYNVTFYMASLDDQMPDGPTVTKTLYAASEEDAEKQLMDSSTDKYYIPTVTKIELVESVKLREGTKQKRIACTTEFDNGNVIHNDWQTIGDDEAEELAKQRSIENPDKVYYVKYDDIMNPCSDYKWKNGQCINESSDASQEPQMKWCVEIEGDFPADSTFDTREEAEQWFSNYVKKYNDEHADGEREYTEDDFEVYIYQDIDTVDKDELIKYLADYFEDTYRYEYTYYKRFVGDIINLLDDVYHLPNYALNDMESDAYQWAYSMCDILEDRVGPSEGDEWDDDLDESINAKEPSIGEIQARVQNYLDNHPYSTNMDIEDICEEVADNLFDLDYHEMSGDASYEIFNIVSRYVDERDESLTEEVGLNEGAYEHIRKGATPKTAKDMLVYKLEQSLKNVSPYSYGRAINLYNNVNDKYRTNFEVCLQSPSNSDNSTLVAMLKDAGCKYIRVRPGGRAEFYYNVDKLEAERLVLVDQSESEYKSAKDMYTQELQAEDIEIYKPTQAILDKLQNYRLKGSKVNVRAIKDLKKLLTYLYGSVVIGWNDLQWDCENQIPSDMKRIKDAILIRAQQDAAYQDTRDDRTQSIAQKFSTVTKFLYENNVGYSFKSRHPSSSECAMDQRNGACWTLGYTLVLDNGLEIQFCDHTNEGGGSYGYSVEGGSMTGKRAAEEQIIAIVRNSLTTSADTNESLTEAFQMTVDLDMLASDVSILLDADVLGEKNWIEVFPTSDSRPIGNNGYILPLEITGPNDDCRKATFTSRGSVVDVRFRNGSEAKCYDAKEIARFIAGEFGVALNESYDPDDDEELSTSRIIQALKNHSVEYKQKNGKLFAIDSYSKNGEWFDDEVDTTGWTYQQLRDFLGY